MLNHDVAGPVTTVRETFVGDGVQVNFTMSVTPATDNDVQVFIGGVHQHPDDWSFSDTTLTFTEAPFDGAKIVAQIGNQVGSLAVPADGSVTAAKIANSAVTDSKLANGSVTQAKLAFSQVFSEMYTTPELIIAPATEVTLMHGLSSRPWFFVVTLNCVVAEDDYEVGDEVALYSGSEWQTVPTGCNVFTRNATHLTVRTGSYSAVFLTLNASGTSTDITPVNWRLVIRALA